MLCLPCSADRLRISPDDLRLRVAVSEELPVSVRRAIKDLARSVPLPVEDGLIQTEQIFEQQLAREAGDEKTDTLMRYYFLVSRLEASQKFSDEFLRREKLLKQGVELLNVYIKKLNPMIARAPYTNLEPFTLKKVQSLPLQSVELNEDGELLLLRRFPAPKLSLGRQVLRSLREEAQEEKDIFKGRLEELRLAEREFLAEVSTIGNELIRMRPSVKQWVTVPGEGLPFSP